MTVQILDSIVRNFSGGVFDIPNLQQGHITLDRVMYGISYKVVIDCYIPYIVGGSSTLKSFIIDQAESYDEGGGLDAWENYLSFSSNGIHWQYPDGWAGTPHLIINMYDGNPEHYQWTYSTPNPYPIYIPGRRTITIDLNSHLTVSGVGYWHYSRITGGYDQDRIRNFTITAPKGTRLYSIKWYYCSNPTTSGEREYTQIDEYLPAVQNGEYGLYSTYTDTMFIEYGTIGINSSGQWTYDKTNYHQWGAYNGFDDLFDVDIETLDKEMYTGGLGPICSYKSVGTLAALESMISNNMVYIGQIISVVNDNTNNGLYHIVSNNGGLIYRKISFAQ